MHSSCTCFSLYAGYHQAQYERAQKCSTNPSQGSSGYTSLKQQVCSCGRLLQQISHVNHILAGGHDQSSCKSCTLQSRLLRALLYEERFRDDSEAIVRRAIKLRRNCKSSSQ